MSEICEGLQVVETGSGSIAASMVGMVLADAGARVIKVEPPEGDALRSANPSGFLVWNRGKESRVIDLRTPGGQEEYRGVCAHADVVVEGFSPGTTEVWGVGANALRQANPGLVHCAITGFGPTGAYSGLKAYDTLVSAKAGLFARGGFGHRDGPILYPVPWASYGAAMQSVAGILSALMVRQTTGRGQAISTTMIGGLDPVDYFVSTIAQLMAKRGEEAALDARTGIAASRYGVLVITRDGRFVQTSTLLPHQGKALTEVAGLGHLLEDPRFSKLPMFNSPEEAQEWEDALWEAFRQKDLAEWMPLLLASPDIAFEVSATSEQGLDHPQIVHNGDTITVEDPTIGPVRQVGPIGHFSATPIVPRRSAPPLGSHAGDFQPRRDQGDSGPAPAHPLEGVTIVEFGYYYAMPYGLAMAAALGARVIKLENADGDPHRMSFGPDVASNKTTAGKESVSLDLRSEEGRSIARRIIAGADVFVNSFRSGVADRLGLGYADLSSINPRLLYVHAAGYGSDGPFASRALYAQAAQAVAGSFGRQVGYWADPAQNIGMSVPELQLIIQPHVNQIVDGDSNAALSVLASIMLGVYHQRRTGTGQLLSTSMISGNAWCYSDDFCTYAGKEPVPVCESEYYGTSALERVYETSDGWICLVVRTDKEFAALCRGLDDDALALDARFSSAAERKDNDADLVGHLEKRFTTRSATEWESLLSRLDVGCVEVNMKGQPAFTSFDPVLRETGLTVEIDHPMYGALVVAAPPVEFSETPGRTGLPCFRGQHNHSVLAEIGLSPAEIAELEANGVLFPETPLPVPTD